MSRARSTAYRVNDILTEYIAVHDDIYGGSLVRRIIPIPGFFRKIPFGKHAQTLDGVGSELNRLRASLDSSAEHRLERALTRYLDALIPTVEKLEEISHSLHSSNHGGPRITHGVSADRT